MTGQDTTSPPPNYYYPPPPSSYNNPPPDPQPQPQQQYQPPPFVPPVQYVNYPPTPYTQNYSTYQNQPYYPTTQHIHEDEYFVTTRRESESSEALCAVLIFVCGFCFLCVWPFGICCIRSKSSAARIFGILSFFLFIVTFLCYLVYGFTYY